MRGTGVWNVGVARWCLVAACLANAIGCGKEQESAPYARSSHADEEDEEAKDEVADQEAEGAGARGIDTADCTTDTVEPEDLGWDAGDVQNYYECPKDADKLTRVPGILMLSLDAPDMAGCFRCLREVEGDLY